VQFGSLDKQAVSIDIHLDTLGILIDRSHNIGGYWYMEVEVELHTEVPVVKH
jgi:hypothetical protein